MSSKGVFFVAVLLVLHSHAIAAPILDQAQPGPRNYGFWFERDVIRWQEFTPEIPVLEQIDVFITKDGSPGDVLVELTNSGGTTLWNYTINESQAPSHDWVSIDVPSIVLNTGQTYRIVINSSEESTSVDNRYYWDGVTNSTYLGGISSVESGWPNFDFCFKTYAVPEPGTLLLLGLGGLGTLKKRRG